MPPRAKRNYIGKLKNQISDSENSEKKKNKMRSVQPNLLVTQNSVNELQKSETNNNQGSIIKLCSGSLKQNENKKPISFWSKKLQELEPIVTEKKKTNLGLYDFNGSEDSFSLKKKLKSSKKKKCNYRKKKTKFPIIIKKSEKDWLEIQGKHMFKRSQKQATEKMTSNRKIVENKENNGEIQKEDKTKVTKTTYPKFLTSTPAPNKAKKVCSSNFIFMSPIKATELEKFPKQNQIEFLSHNISKKSDKIILKSEVENEEVKCLRVLRNRKILIRN